jgi:pSer/pThr/pTyr-binding forkhead associated (FHA) protein
MEAPVMTILLRIGGNLDRLTFCKESIRFGKHPDNEVCTSGHSVRVSRSHAVLSWDGERWLIRDHNSLYGTYVNGHRVESEAALEVKSGDRICIGDIELEARYSI